MVSDVIKVTSLRAGLLPEDLVLLDRYASMIPADWLALLRAFGAGTLNGCLSLFEPGQFKKLFWPFDRGGDELSKLRALGEPVRLDWVDQGVLTLGKCDWGWVTTGLPGTTELRLHSSIDHNEVTETFSSLDHLLEQFTRLPCRTLAWPSRSVFESLLDRRCAGSQESYDASRLVPNIQSLVPDFVFVCHYSLCFRFLVHEALIELGNYLLEDNNGVQLSVIFNPSKADPSLPFFAELHRLLRS